ncbi:MAG TPA: hypothetical protein VKA19_00695, partial [Alphaproteobacteria bacterium]|nr:hypothetical protein [Alphaproteobacteria bacterium]
MKRLRVHVARDYERKPHREINRPPLLSFFGISKQRLGDKTEFGRRRIFFRCQQQAQPPQTPPGLTTTGP